MGSHYNQIPVNNNEQLEIYWRRVVSKKGIKNVIVACIILTSFSERFHHNICERVRRISKGHEGHETNQGNYPMEYML